MLYGLLSGKTRQIFVGPMCPQFICITSPWARDYALDEG